MATLEFRDGSREVPDYLEPILRGLETFRMTYEEALREANRKMLADHINAQHDRIVSAHLREVSRWG